MTTIDRIMSKVNEQKFDSKYIDADNIRQILEKELTVNGVDELVEKRENTRQTLSYIASRWCREDVGKYKQIMDCISDLKSLNQTPVKDSQPKEVEINKRDENRDIINKIMKDINILSFKNCNWDKCIKIHQVNKSLEKYLIPEIITYKN